MLQKFHAGDHVETGRFAFGQLLGGDPPIIQFRAGLQARFQLVQLGDRQRRLTHVDTQHAGAAQGHALGQDAAAAADVQRPPAAQPPARSAM